MIDDNLYVLLNFHFSLSDAKCWEFLTWEKRTLCAESVNCEGVVMALKRVMHKSSHGDTRIYLCF